MAKIITDYLEENADKYPQKAAYIDQYESVTYKELQDRTYKIACQLINKGFAKNPIAIYLEKNIQCISTMLGVLCSGNFYTVLDMDMPAERIKKIVSVLSPAAIITDAGHRKQCGQIPGQNDILIYENLLEDPYDIEQIEERKKKILSSDLSQVIFTSGSTGTPKGVMLSHGGVISATESRTDHLGYKGSDIFANQFPFHFVGYLADFFCTLKNGATDYIIPKELFFAPKQLVEFIKDKKITVLDWIAPALCLIAKYGALSDVILPHIKVVAFGGEPMPVKYLRLWKRALPNADFMNAYGSSELGGGILFYKVNREFEDKDRLPLGFAIEEAEVFLIDENNESSIEKGELCVKSSQLAVGYYNNAEETSKKFVLFCDRSGKNITLFKTGDFVKYNEQGELIFLGRRDFQIKRHGYRIEPGEIECAVGALDGIRDTACIYDRNKEKIVLFYSGDAADEELKKNMKRIIPHYMIPDIYIELKEIPRTINRKIDRVKLNTLYEEYSEDV